MISNNFMNVNEMQLNTRLEKRKDDEEKKTDVELQIVCNLNIVS